MHTTDQHQTSTVTFRNRTETVYDNWTIVGFSTVAMTGKTDPQEEIVRMIQVSEDLLLLSSELLEIC